MDAVVQSASEPSRQPGKRNLKAFHTNDCTMTY
jgi:hypothetical protein